jgi:hypothetical protein
MVHGLCPSKAGAFSDLFFVMILYSTNSIIGNIFQILLLSLVFGMMYMFWADLRAMDAYTPDPREEEEIASVYLWEEEPLPMYEPTSDLTIDIEGIQEPPPIYIPPYSVKNTNIQIVHHL